MATLARKRDLEPVNNVYVGECAGDPSVSPGLVGGVGSIVTRIDGDMPGVERFRKSDTGDTDWTRLEGAIADEFEAEGESYQTIAADLNVGPDVGSTDDDPKFIAPFMGNVIGDTQTAEGIYLAGMIAAFSVLGAKTSKWPVGALLGIIMDGVSEADGAVVAHIDGDSEVTRANAAFKAMMRNSTPGSGFDYGLDLMDPAFGSYAALSYAKALIRGPGDWCLIVGSGAPVDYTDGDPVATGEGYAGEGSIYIRASGADSNAYINVGTVMGQPTWKLFTRAA